MKHLTKRGKLYVYYRRIPQELLEYDKRKFVRISLKTSNLSIAAKKAEEIDIQVEKYWNELVNLNAYYDDKKFQQAIKLANLWGVPYLQNADLAKSSSLNEITARIEALEKGGLKQADAAVLLGTVAAPDITMQKALENFWRFAKDKIINKSPDQIRKWKNPRKKAIKNFISVVGNKRIETITRFDILNFRDWWIEKIQRNELTTATANKDLIHVKNILDVVSENLKLDLEIPKLFKKIIMEEHWSQKRLPFAADYIIETLLNPNNLIGLSDEEKYFLYAFADTGARGTELVGLTSENIILNHAVPHIQIRPRRYKDLKTDYSKRDIPLVGYAFEAFKKLPNGFEKFHDKPDHISNSTNKFLREKGLFPTDQHTVYSLRHSFQDRLTAVDAPDRIQAELMGHKFDRPQYGDGPSLELKLEWMKKIRLR